MNSVIDTITKIIQSSEDIELIPSTESPFKEVVIENLVVDEPSQKLTVEDDAELRASYESKITTESHLDVKQNGLTETVTESEIQFTEYEPDQTSESPEANEIPSENNDIDPEFIPLDTEPLMEEDSLNHFGENEQELVATTSEPELTEHTEPHLDVTIKEEKSATATVEDFETTSSLPTESHITFKDDDLYSENEIENFEEFTTQGISTSDIISDEFKSNDFLTTLAPELSTQGVEYFSVKTMEPHAPISTTVKYSMTENIQTTTEYSTRPTTVITPKLVSSTEQPSTTVKGIFSQDTFH